MAVYVRYAGDGPRFGELVGDMIHPLTGAPGSFAPSGEAPVAAASVRLLAPVEPSKIVAVGPNYKAHLQGGDPPGRPYYWIKPSTAVLDPEGIIELPAEPPMVCHESELAIVIGKRLRKVSPDEAAAGIFGYSCINDVSAGQLTDMAAYFASQYFVDGKIYDTFAPIGPVIVTGIDATDLRVQCRVNGQTRQDHRTSDQIWPPAQLVSIISQTLTLLPGDVVATGSPPGPGPLADGDVVEVEVEGIGILRNLVRNT